MRTRRTRNGPIKQIKLVSSDQTEKVIDVLAEIRDWLHKVALEIEANKSTTERLFGSLIEIERSKTAANIGRFHLQILLDLICQQCSDNAKYGMRVTPDFWNAISEREHRLREIYFSK